MRRSSRTPMQVNAFLFHGTLKKQGHLSKFGKNLCIQNILPKERQKEAGLKVLPPSLDVAKEGVKATGV